MQNLKYFSIKYLLYISVHPFYVCNDICHFLLQQDGMIFLLNSFYLYMHDSANVFKLSLCIVFLSEFQKPLHLCIRNFQLKPQNHRRSEAGRENSGSSGPTALHKQAHSRSHCTRLCLNGS